MSQILKIPVEDISDDISTENCQKWDSLNHINLMLAIEQEYGVSFSDDELVSLVSLDKLSEAVTNYTDSHD